MSSKHEPFIIADIDNKFQNQKSLNIYKNPVNIVRADSPDEIPGAIRDLDLLARQDKYLAGFITYEAGRILQGHKLDLPGNYTAPLLWFGQFIEENKFEPDYIPQNFYLSDPVPQLKISDYEKGFDQIKKYIRDGLVYQINYTFFSEFKFFGDLISLFFALKKNQNSAYNFLISLGDYNIISLSPELFFFKSQNRIWTKPMKGTLEKSADPDIDEINIQKILVDKKNQAENAMITDILRNDLGRICAGNSVTVENYYELEEYKTLYQLTSTVSGSLKNNLGYENIFKALFPSASVTGAPKLEAMKRIDELENRPRGIYTGGIGIIRPHGETLFNVAIRTLELIQSSGRIGIGSGIVFDSQKQNEYDEALLKSRFLKKDYDEFYLFETILFSRGRYRLLSNHLDRIFHSAQKMNFSFEREKIKTDLENLKILLRDQDRYRIKLVLSPDGYVTLHHEKFVNPRKIFKMMLSKIPVDASNSLLYHKSNRRQLFDDCRKLALQDGFDEVLFLNKDGEVTECCIHNIMAKINNKWYTPDIRCGLLPGTMREYLLKKSWIKEKVLRLEDLKLADKIAVMNSLRGIHLANIIF